MATSKKCSICTKQAGPMYCTGCDGYFCWKDFKSHRDNMLSEMDKIIEERNHLQDLIHNVPQNNSQQNPIIEQIKKWENSTIEKVKQVASQACQQALQLLNSKQIKVNSEFRSFSQELTELRESENYVEHDLQRLNQMINKFKEDLKQSTQPTKIELHTEQSNAINWSRLIYVKEKQIIRKFIILHKQKYLYMGYVHKSHFEQT